MIRKKITGIMFFLIVALIISLIGVVGCANQSAAPAPQGDAVTVSLETTAIDGFPPHIPHTLVDRDQCIVCHRDGEVGNAPKTPHPDFTNCRQCHVHVGEV